MLNFVRCSNRELAVILINVRCILNDLFESSVPNDEIIGYYGEMEQALMEEITKRFLDCEVNLYA